mgnify:CR=1 FL=1
MITILDKRNCCGCTACYNVCSKKAIEMVSDEQGFLYPKVNNENCIQCGLCNKVCPYLNDARPQIDLEKAFIGINTDETIRGKSSSGGMFALLAEKVLERNGVVFGAAYDSEWMVYHKSVETQEQLSDLIGSKYLQSCLGDSFSQVKKLLLNKIEVMFVGTTCQINGLKNYLNKDYSNLFTVDFICLGVPSPMIWRDYLETFFGNETIRSVNFKDKSLGWHTFSLRIDKQSGVFCKNGRETYYFTGYFRHLYTRPSCSNCVAKLGNRMSDITISDCWGYDAIAPELDDNKGMSSIVCHTEKGMTLFEACKEQLIWKDGWLEDILKYNPGYRISAPEGENSKDFWRDYYKISKKRLFRKYCTPTKTDFISRSIRKVEKLFKGKR